jgi:predicted transposase/invertase (TIGR01784 family)
MISGINPTVDYIFKMLFGSEANVALLISLLQAVLNPPDEQRLTAVTILNPFNDKESLDDKLSILDIKARDQAGRQYNIEMQMFGKGVLLDRLLYYWAVLHSEQLHEGDDYKTLQPTISICFLNDIVFPRVADHHLDFQLRSRRHPKLVYSTHQSLHLVQLPKFLKKAEELTSLLDVWCYFLTHGAELDIDNLPVALQGTAPRRAMEVLYMVAQSDSERERYQSRLKAKRDLNMWLFDAREEALKEGLQEGRQKGLQEGLQEGRQKGLQEGLQQGLQEGRQEGHLVGQIAAFQRALRQPRTPKEQLLALPLTELAAMVERLEKQLDAEPRSAGEVSL